MPRKVNKVGIRSIAARAGLSMGAVSMALRDDPAIAAKTRERVRRIAEELGYRPNARVSELMSLLKTRQMAVDAEVIAFVVVIGRGDVRMRRLLDEVEAAGAARAEALGYRLETFPVFDKGIPAPRLREILRARGIRGVIFSPHHEVTAAVDFDCAGLATVIVGQSVASPRTHRVVTAHFWNVRMAMAQLRARGYRRIGLMINEDADARSRNLLSSGVIDFARGLPVKERVSPYVGPLARASVLKWAERHRPDAIIAYPCAAVWELLGGKEPNPERLGVVLLDRGPDLGRFAGVGFNLPVLAASAVDHVVAALRTNTFGLPEHPQTISVEGTWLDGESVRALRGPVEVPLFTPGAMR